MCGKLGHGSKECEDPKEKLEEELQYEGWIRANLRIGAGIYKKGKRLDPTRVGEEEGIRRQDEFRRQIEPYQRRGSDESSGKFKFPDRKWVKKDVGEPTPRESFRTGSSSPGEHNYPDECFCND